MIGAAIVIVAAIVCGVIVTLLNRRGRDSITIGGARVPPGCEGPAIRSYSERVARDEFRVLRQAEMEKLLADVLDRVHSEAVFTDNEQGDPKVPSEG